MTAEVSSQTPPAISFGSVRGRACAHIRRNGIQCKAHALRGDECCWFHSSDPIAMERRDAGRRQGGKSRIVRKDRHWTNLQLEGRADVKDAATAILNAIMRGDIHPSSANAAIAALSLVRGLLNDAESLEGNGETYTPEQVQQRVEDAWHDARSFIEAIFSEHPEIKVDVLRRMNEVYPFEKRRRNETG